ncbi:MAG: hypothetical protein ACTS7E_02250 [Arsenophonus sp. NC-CH8-MAG3]
MLQTECTVICCKIYFLNNIYYADKLAGKHGREVCNEYGTHNTNKIIV